MQPSELYLKILKEAGLIVDYSLDGDKIVVQQVEPLGDVEIKLDEYKIKNNFSSLDKIRHSTPI